MPHAHILIILEDQDKPKTIEDINNIVSAEIPDPVLYPQAYETVTSCMSHGYCGALNPKSPCMVDGKCSKRYPKQFQPETTTSSDGYPVYRRRDNGRTFTGKNKETIDNCHIVPYNLTLATVFNCHINVEICSTVRAVKYIYKYIFKGILK